MYPFVKVRPWYALPLEERKRAMDEHIRIGREFETIHNHTTYSFGIDDQEFMTAFECDEPSDFMHLMQTLRESEASAYTERDTPIFVGEGMPIRAALDALDGASAQCAIRCAPDASAALLPLLLVLALALAGCGGEETAAPEAALDRAVEELANVLQLRSDFEADAGKTRAILLFSPT